MLSQGSNIHFTRSLSGILAEEWQQVLFLISISTSSFTHHHDKIAWRWDSSGLFTCRSIYKLLNFRGVNDNKNTIIWTLSIPPKIRIFVWLLLNNMILTKKKILGGDGMVICNDNFAL